MNKKILKTTVALGASISTGVIASNVAHASDSNTSNQDGLVITAKQPTNPTVTKDQVSTAQNNYTNSNTKLADTKAKASANLTNTNNLKSSVANTKQNIEDVKNAKTTITEIDKKVATNKNLINQATETKEKASKQVADTTKEVNNLQTSIDKSTVEVKNIQDKKSTLEKEVDTLGSSDATLNEKQNKLAKAKEVKEKTNNVLIQKQEDLAKAKVDNVKTQQNLDAINSDIAKTKEELSNTNKLLDNQRVTEKAALDELNKLRNSTFGTARTDIKLDANYVAALKTYLEKVKSIPYSDPNFMEKIQQAAKPVIEVERKVQKVSRPSEYKYKQVDLVDVAHMSQADQDHFAQYFTHLLNQIRSQFGKPAIKVNKNTQELARRISNNIVKANYLEADHYIPGILDAARSMNLKAYPGQNHFENLYTGYVSSNGKSLLPRAYLYDQVYFWTQHFFYEGNLTRSYLHATALLRNEDNIGVSFAFMPTSNAGRDYSTLKLSVINVHKYLTDSNTYANKYSTTSNAALETVKPVDASKYVQAYNKASEEVKATTDKLNTIQKSLDNKTKELATTKAKLVDIQAIEQEITKANNIISQVNLAIDNLEKEIKAIRENLNTTNEVLRAKTKELETVTKELQEKQDKLAADKEKYQETSKALEEDKANLTKISTILEKLDTSLVELGKQKQELLDKVANLDKYQEELATYTQLLAASETVDTNLTKEVEKLTKEVSDNLAEYNKLLKQYQLENLVYAVTQDAPIVEPVEFDINSLNKPQEDNKKQDTVKPLETNSVTTTQGKHNTTHNTKTNTQKQTKAKVLPNTGTESNSTTQYTAILLSILAGLGINLKRKNN